MRKLVPKKDEPEYAKFVADPEKYFLSAIPSWFQSTRFMAVIDILSTHSTDEEYIGERKDLSTWSGDSEIIEAFYRFSMEMKRIEKEIEKRNGDPNLRNRHVNGISSYELLIPSSRHGVTCRGVPNSITI
ncbi:linoleate 13S-lipoxygenase 3-1, chloroplastic-like [Fagus crenata]